MVAVPAGSRSSFTGVSSAAGPERRGRAGRVRPGLARDPAFPVSIGIPLTLVWVQRACGSPARETKSRQDPAAAQASTGNSRQWGFAVVT